MLLPWVFGPLEIIECLDRRARVDGLLAVGCWALFILFMILYGKGIPLSGKSEQGVAVD